MYLNVYITQFTPFKNISQLKVIPRVNMNTYFFLQQIIPLK